MYMEIREQLGKEARNNAPSFLPPFCLLSIESPGGAVVLFLHGPPNHGVSPMLIVELSYHNCESKVAIIDY